VGQTYALEKVVGEAGGTVLVGGRYGGCVGGMGVLDGMGVFVGV
jgi:hypothetical protein